MGKYSTKISSLLNGEQDVASLKGEIFEDTSQNRQRWKEWWKTINTEHFLIFWLLGLITIVTLSMLSKVTVYGQAAESGLGFLFLEAAAIGEQTLPVFRLLFLLVSAVMLFSTQVGVLESSSRIISENVVLMLKPLHHKINMSKYFYMALWGQILMGCGVYLTGFSEPRALITLAALINAFMMMVSFPLMYLLNSTKLRKEMHPSKFRMVVMLVAFLFFLYFFTTLIFS